MKKLNQLQEVKKYFDIPDEAIAFLQNATAATEDGHYEFGPDCYINVMGITTTTESGMMEAHRVYVDVQYVISGEEKIYYADCDGLQQTQAYDAEKDFLLYALPDGAANVDYFAGEAVILYPQDAHLPCRPVHAPMQVKKAVIKIRQGA